MPRADTWEMESTSPPPVILVDIDGTCSPMCRSDLLPSRWSPWTRSQFGWNKGWTSTALGEALQQLARVADVRWCTGWEAEAAGYGAALGLDVPWVPLGAGGAGHMWKLSAVDTSLPDQPVWWIDDEHDESSHRWAADREARGVATTVVACDPNVGVTADDVADATRWVEDLVRR